MTPDKLDTARKLLAAGDKPVKIAKLLHEQFCEFDVIKPATSVC